VQKVFEIQIFLINSKVELFFGRIKRISHLLVSTLITESKFSIEKLQRFLISTDFDFTINSCLLKFNNSILISERFIGLIASIS
jgi:hypothetical protein